MSRLNVIIYRELQCTGQTRISKEIKCRFKPVKRWEIVSRYDAGKEIGEKMKVKRKKKVEKVVLEVLYEEPQLQTSCMQYISAR